MFIFFSSFTQEFKFWLTIGLTCNGLLHSLFMMRAVTLPTVGQALIVISNIQLYFTLQLLLIH